MATVERPPMSSFDTFRRGRWMVCLWLIPAVCVGLAVCYWVWTKRTLSQRLEHELTELRQAGLPVDAASLNDYWLQQTSTEHTDQWLELLHVDSHIYHRYLVRNNVAYWPQSDSGSKLDQADEEESTRAFLEYVQPIFGKFRQVPLEQQVVWLPPDASMGGGYYWHLQQAQLLGRLFQLELEDALRSGDKSRAILAIEDAAKLARSMNSYLRIFDFQDSIVLRAMQWAMIRECLAHDAWTNEELSRLFDMTDSNFNPLQKWEPMIHCFRVMLLATAMEPQPRLFLPGPRWMMEREAKALEFLEACEEVLELPQRNVPELMMALQGLLPKDTMDANPYVERFMPNGKTFALSWLIVTLAQIESTETQWKLTRTAIAVRLYRQTYGQWPERLDQLLKVGLRSNEWTHPNPIAQSSFEQFGYEVHDDIAYVGFARQFEMSEQSTWPIGPETASAYNLTLIRHNPQSETK